MDRVTRTVRVNEKLFAITTDDAHYRSCMGKHILQISGENDECMEQSIFHVLFIMNANISNTAPSVDFVICKLFISAFMLAFQSKRKFSSGGIG